MELSAILQQESALELQPFAPCQQQAFPPSVRLVLRFRRSLLIKTTCGVDNPQQPESWLTR